MANSGLVEQTLGDMNALNLNPSLLPNKVFVGGLAEKTETRDLREMFNEYAPVQDVKIIVDRSIISKSGDPRRYAFIAFESPEEVKKVLAALSDKSLDLHGRRLTVGQAFRKPQIYNRYLAPTLLPPFVHVDPYASYRAWAAIAPGKAGMMQSVSMNPPSAPYTLPYMTPAAYGFDPALIYSPGPMMSPYASGTISAPVSPGVSQMHSSHMYSQMKNVIPSNGLNNDYVNMSNGSSGCNSLDDSTSDVYAAYKMQPTLSNGNDQRQRQNGRINMVNSMRIPSSNPTANGHHYMHQGPTLATEPRFMGSIPRQQFAV
ncbi:protein boule-like [Paramacrobiotus metropolitanus]|uniref:protein boule-like n=1 Tax=Paramacrobiotus metropolitanus TaxID=2943436 RepID=UPI0024457A2D|nr:protein boule-like [Paramacrobiotus metropolitanus]